MPIKSGPPRTTQTVMPHHPCHNYAQPAHSPCRHLEASQPDAPKPTPLSSFMAPAERARYTRMPRDGLVVLQVRA